MEQFKEVCSNPWCKGHFIYTLQDIIIDDGNEIHPRQCKKCQSFNNELSGGVDWKDKEYEGSRIDNTPHQIKYKVTNFRL